MREISVGDFRKNMAKELEKLPFVLTKNGIIVGTLLPGFVQDVGSDIKNKKDFVQSAPVKADKEKDFVQNESITENLPGIVPGVGDRLRKNLNIKSQQPDIPDQSQSGTFRSYTKEQQTGKKNAK